MKKQKLKILLAEDNLMLRTLFAAIADESKIDLIMASNGQEAVELAEKFDFNLIIMDVEMPVMNGLDATARIKQIKPNIPVVAFTELQETTVYKHQASKYLDSIYHNKTNPESFSDIIRIYSKKSA